MIGLDPAPMGCVQTSEFVETGIVGHEAAGLFSLTDPQT